MSDRTTTEDALKARGWVKDARGDWHKPKRPLPPRPPPVEMTVKQFVSATKKVAKMPQYQQTFVLLWQRLGGPRLTAEHKFHPARKWRLDYANVGTKVGIELHGGVWQQGRHTRGGGFIGDREKMNAAQRLGWTVFELAPEMVNEMQVKDIIETIRNRQS